MAIKAIFSGVYTLSPAAKRFGELANTPLRAWFQWSVCLRRDKAPLSPWADAFWGSAVPAKVWSLSDREAVHHRVPAWHSPCPRWRISYVSLWGERRGATWPQPSASATLQIQPGRQDLSKPRWRLLCTGECPPAVLASFSFRVHLIILLSTKFHHFLLFTKEKKHREACSKIHTGERGVVKGFT